MHKGDLLKFRYSFRENGCVGHDTLFIKYLNGPLTILAVKDRVLAHNPLGAVYAEFYLEKKLAGHKKNSRE
jgi:hypothetical protein